MKKPKSLLVKIMVTCALATSSFSFAQLSMTIQTPVRGVTSHEPMTTLLVISNRGSQPVLLDLGAGRESGLELLASVRGSAERSYRLPVKEGISRLGKIEIQPDSSYSQELLLNKWLDVYRPGQYAVRIRLDGSLNPSLEKENLASPVTRFDVLPRDEARLTATCASLKDRILGAASVEEIMNLTSELAAVRDPVAVPFLKDLLLRRPREEPVLILGLRDIADRRAVNALAEATTSKNLDGMFQLMSYEAIKYIAERGNDPAVKQFAASRLRNLALPKCEICAVRPVAQTKQAK